MHIYTLRSVLVILLLMVVLPGGWAQTLKGFVIDGETSRPLFPAKVMNLATQQITNTDEEGNFVILARTGDTIAVSLMGYHTIQHRAVPGAMVRIELYQLSVKMPEYVVHELTKFQKDSMELTHMYSHELNKRPASVGFSNANGGGFTGLISTPLQRMTKSYKQNKRFKENFERDMEQRYVDSRYTPELTSSITGLQGDSVAVFMNSYPMEHAFARTATDLELKMWIRNNYNVYVSKAKTARRR